MYCNKKKEQRVENNIGNDYTGLTYSTKDLITFLTVLIVLSFIYFYGQHQQIYKAIDTLKLIEDREDRIVKEKYINISTQLTELTGIASEENDAGFYLTCIENIVSSNNKRLESEDVENIAQNIYESALKYKFNPLLICALIKVESDFIVDSVSNSDAYGLCQVRSLTAYKIAPSMGISWDGAEKTLFNPEKNIKIGVYYLSLLYNDFKDIKLALTANNYGPGKVQEFLSQNIDIPDGYPEKVWRYYIQYQGLALKRIDEKLNDKKA